MNMISYINSLNVERTNLLFYNDAKVFAELVLRLCQDEVLELLANKVARTHPLRMTNS